MSATKEPSPLVAERSRFDREDSLRLARQAAPTAVPANIHASTRFSYFETDRSFIVVCGVQEESDAGLALAYGMKLRADRKLVLILPTSCSLATRQRVPFFQCSAQPDIWHHPLPWGGKGRSKAQLAKPQTRDQAIRRFERRLGKNLTPELELADAATPKHLGRPRTSAVSALVDWATTHPLLDPGHRQGERAWQCMGQKVLTIRPSAGKGLAIRAGIHYSKTGEAPDPFLLAAKDTLSSDDLNKIKTKVSNAIALRLDGKKKFHKPDEHWLQAVIRRAPELVGVEPAALREVPAWRPGGVGWGRGYIDLLGLDGSGDIRVVETKLGKNADDLLILQGLDYYVWTQAYGDALRRRLGASKESEFTIHYVVGAVPETDAVHTSIYAQAQADALDVPWSAHVVKGWFNSPQAPVSGATTKPCPAGTLPGHPAISPKGV